MFSLDVSGDERLLAFIIYNFCAFAVQMPAGAVADRLNRNTAVASVGLCLATAAFFCTGAPILCASVLGLGNCLYHVGGGCDVLGFEREKQWMLGVFVSPGAIGLYLGTILAKRGEVSVVLAASIIAVLSAAVIFLLNYAHPLGASSNNPKFSLKSKGRAPLFAAICLFSVVVLRSYVGLTLDTPWKSGALLPLLSVLGVALGKTAGGFIADRFGEMKAAAASLALSAVLFLFPRSAICGIAAIFLFNMSMPLTLFAMARIFPASRGFAFGALTFALFLGCVPSFLSLPVPFYGETWFHAVLSAVSLVLLAVGLALSQAGGDQNE